MPRGGDLAGVANIATSLFSILVIFIFLGISIYFFVHPTNSTGKIVALVFMCITGYMVLINVFNILYHSTKTV
jgi:hypothetical protein